MLQFWLALFVIWTIYGSGIYTQIEVFEPISSFHSQPTNNLSSMQIVNFQIRQMFESCTNAINHRRMQPNQPKPIEYDLCMKIT